MKVFLIILSELLLHQANCKPAIQARTQSCPERLNISNPFATFTDEFDLKNVLYVCEFYSVSHDYKCKYTVDGFALLLPKEKKTQIEERPAGSIPVFSVPSEDSSPSVEVNIEFLSEADAKVSLFCNTPSHDDTDVSAIRPAETSGSWTEGDGFLKDSLNSVPGSGLLAKCFFRSTATYECFGIPACPENCDEPCTGGEPWRGKYTGDPHSGFSGNITDLSLPSSGTQMNTPVIIPANGRDISVPLKFCLPPKECKSWNAELVLNQNGLAEPKLCKNLAFLLSN